MTNIKGKLSIRLTVTGIVLALTAGGAFADKPVWAGGGKHKEEKHKEKQQHKEGPQLKEEKERDARDRYDTRHDGEVAFSFDNDARRIISEYYGAQVSQGKCPPGLAKKNNGCQPPGQAKKWHKGQPLAKDIKYNKLPAELLVRLPAPPPNHRYVQVAGDILMIATGSSMVIDGITDILR